MPRTRRRIASLTGFALLVAGGLTYVTHRGHSVPPTCGVSAAGTTYVLDPDQAANAATIAVVGHREGLPNHAVTVALATALQESKLRNLHYGDRDSVGLFQQRPSQGWGPRASLLDPVYAATAFYSHLRKVDGWRTRAVADAAQAVQRSADGSAYAGWETEARAMAVTLTGEGPVTALSCVFSRPAPAAPGAGTAALTAAQGTELGGLVGQTADAPARRVVAAWLVAHAYAFGVASVTVDGARWTPDGHWRPTAGTAAGTAPGYTLVAGR